MVDKKDLPENYKSKKLEIRMAGKKGNPKDDFPKVDPD
jgi:hypothetical protein